MVARYIDNVISKGQKLVPVQGAINYNGSSWDIIDNATHIRAKNVLSVTGTKTPVVNYEHTFSRVSWFSAWIDETYARVFQLHVGATVGVSSASIQIYYGGGPVQIDCNYSSGWNVATHGSTRFGPVATGLGISESAGKITVTHDALPGIATVQPLGAFRADVVNTSFSETSTEVELRDFSNTLITSHTTSHKFVLERCRKHGAEIDATELNESGSNLWFAGEFEL